jgi:hypothetical protein
MQDSIKTLGYVQFATHRVDVSHDDASDQYVCFKSTDTRCDFETFQEIESAVDYILEPMPSLVYNLVLGGDPDGKSTN